MRSRSNEHPSRPSARSILASVATAGLLASALVVGTAGAASAAPATPGSIGQTAFKAGRYIVTLADNSVATYNGGIAGLNGTTPDAGDQLNARLAPVQKYADYLASKQNDVAAAVGAIIDYSYTMASNAFSADLTAAQAAKLATSRGVLSVTPDELLHPVATPSTEFLGLEGAGGVWEAVGGADQAGEGVVVGVLDTGIAPENPAFAGDPLGTTAGTDPYLSGPGEISYVKGDGSTFTGICETGTQFTVDDCSTKVVGARYFVDGFGEENLGDATTGPGEFVSPRDGDGHGSHTASTAAGNLDTPTEVLGRDFGTISGVAPAAKIAAYKVCWSGPDDSVTTDDGCTTSDMLAAIDQAVLDGVDVLNFSIGGGSASTTYSLTDDAFLGAASAGIFVAASAGNDGPGASTLDNASPWYTTVAASTIPSYEATATLGDGTAFAGASITVEEPVSGSLVNSTAVAVDGDAGEQANLCVEGSLDASLVEPDTIIVCERGVNDRVAKSAEVLRAGGIGMILANVTTGSIDLDNHSVPTVHVDAPFHDAIVAYAATPGATATLTEGNSTDITPPTPQLAGFSSHGPVLADGSDIIKPDITAPGVAILAATSNAADADPTFAFLSGTSMAAPHIAGLAALYLGENPQASPSEIKSAMMTTAYDTVDATGAAVTDPFAQGAGHVDPTKFFNPGLLYLNGPADWYSYLQGIGYDFGVEPVDASNLNLASIGIGALTGPETITRTVTSTQAGEFTASIEGLEGISATVEPAVLSFAAAGEQQSYSISFERTTAEVDAYATGSVTWTSGETAVRSPIAVQPSALLAPADVEGTGVTGSTDVTVTPGFTGEIPLSSSGLSRSTVQEDPTGVSPDHSGSGVADDFIDYEVTVGEGTELARFDLDSLSDTDDLDLFVYQLDETGAAVALFQSATGSADERVDIVDPEPATYIAEVVVYSTPTTAVWDLTTTAVAAEGASALAFDPSVLAVQQGVDVTYTTSWSDLEPASSYVGVVHYGGTETTTVLTVVTGDAPQPDAPVNTAPPTITGTPEVGEQLTADTGTWTPEGLTFTYQWQADGADIARATGATYGVTKAQQGKEITVVVTATTAEGGTASATSAPVTVKFQSTTKVDLRKVAFSWQTLTAKITVTAGDVPPTGTVSLRIDGKSVEVPITAADNGVISYKLPKLSRGSHTIRATYSGDEANEGSRSSFASVRVVF